ncbi:putative O-methyltransferase YrrM [Streptomyces sp. V4I23]|uniref:O-methyltransferase n=1 Tax=Streptomyces sp. V4I23 TaxID=3042282 RepID=UPI002782534D|nr:hypothetical protein [Streptomyces sp. V4I23]MDQ1007707.1 putative O-methyltransferase YrrM [Streptomyces sp. V4I23]
MQTERLSRLTTEQADRVAGTVLGRLYEGGALPEPPADVWEDFHRARARIQDSFQVPFSSLTPLAARVLYGIAATARPRALLGVGTYAGNLFGFLTAAGFGATCGYEGECAVGLDVDAGATALATRNFRRAGYAGTVRFETRDGRTPPAPPPGGWSLVLLDADDPVRRKGIYDEVLRSVEPHLADGALVLAHDTAYPKFTADLAPYLARVRSDVYRGSVALPVDEYGIELSVHGRSTP